MKKFARSMIAALALIMVAGALSACVDTESGKSASAQRASDSAAASAKAANRAASVSSQK